MSSSESEKAKIPVVKYSQLAEATEEQKQNLLVLKLSDYMCVEVEEGNDTESFQQVGEVISKYGSQYSKGL